MASIAVTDGTATLECGGIADWIFISRLEVPISMGVTENQSAVFGPLLDPDLS